MKKEYLKMPWSMEDTIENLREIKVMMQQVLVRANKDGKGEEDKKEVDFDFDRAINALEKQIPKKVKAEKYMYGKTYHCPNCNIFVGYNDDLSLPKYCQCCGQALDWGQENEK